MKKYSTEEVLNLAKNEGMRFAIENPDWIEENWFIWFNPNTGRFENQDGEEEDISEDTFSWIEYTVQ